MRQTWVKVVSSTCTPYSINGAIGVIDKRTQAICKIHQSEAYLIILALFDNGVFIQKENKFCVTVCKDKIRKLKVKEARIMVLEAILRDEFL